MSLPPNKSDQEEKPQRQLYACVDQDSGKTFFASFIDRRGSYIELRSSWVASRGKAVILMPVPGEWDGKEFTPAQIREAPNSFEAHVNRAESRGQFQIRLLSVDQQDMVEQLQGRRPKDNLVLEQSHVGKIDILKLSGRISMESMGRLQVALRTEPGTQRLVLLDIRELISIPGVCLGLLYTMMKEEGEKGLIASFLFKPHSRVEDELNASRIIDFVPMYNEYEQAVAYLLKAIFE